MEREIEILSVASPSHASEEEEVGPAMPEMAVPPGLIGSALFFSCIAERVRDIVGQQLEIRKRE